ncbi:DUF1735 domain-containing protein [Limibacterium fermenti]|jgi:hypothetical protein|uniref:DUF1735 domain-containing protein n=1 Tax=Limibacterium fermenti TaxID=3229863 RepID=UPI000E9FF0C7|nr:hypothetical protein [Porphyromonadaceae bacterium]
MKKYKYGLIISALVALVMGFTSCLNDDMIDDQKYGIINLNANKIIEFPDGAESFTLKNEGSKQLKLGGIRLAAEKPASEDIVVSLTIDRSAEILGASTPLLPSNVITFPATITIPAGRRVSDSITITINTDELKADPQYLAISIASIDKSDYLVSGNLGYLTLNFKGPHQWEGRYALTGTMTDAASPNLTHVSSLWVIDTKNNPNGDPYTVQIRTKNSTTLMFFDEIIQGDYIYPISTGTSYSGYGSFAPEFVFDEEGNITAVVNHHGQPAANTREAELDPSGVNKYDEATKSFQVSYWMNQPSSIAGHRSHIVETYTFIEELE